MSLKDLHLVRGLFVKVLFKGRLANNEVVG